VWFVPQVAVFDTAFHSSLPAAAAIYPGPYESAERGIRKLGFHGINHEYCAGRAAQMLRKDLRELKLITCHLGNGCSLAAIRNRRSIDTTMGFTPLESASSMSDVNGFEISHHGLGIAAGHIKARHGPPRRLARTRDRCGQQFD
jgi:acetate kinase